MADYDQRVNSPSPQASQPLIIHAPADAMVSAQSTATAMGAHSVVQINLNAATATVQGQSVQPPLVGLGSRLFEAAASLARRFSTEVERVTQQLRNAFHTSLTANRASVQEHPLQVQALVGQSFKPQVAEKLLHVLSFDGVGRLIGPKEGARTVNAKELALLQSGRLEKPLSQMNRRLPAI